MASSSIPKLDDAEVAEVRDRFNKEWNALGIVAGLFAVTAAVFFVTPPAAVLANETEAIVGLYGFCSGGSVLAGLSAVICVSVYQMLLNRTRNDRIGRFIHAFRFFLQIPLYCLVASAVGLAFVALIAVHAVYNNVFIASIVLVPVAFINGIIQLTYMYYVIKPDLNSAVNSMNTATVSPEFPGNGQSGSASGP